jgi:NAD(P)-dependent dehydrogenase (short-subunit alcohol dehydrogenase family)
MNTPSDMTGKVALITGAGSGLGQGTAIALTKAGAKTFLVDINAAGLEETSTLIRELGGECRNFTADLSKVAHCQQSVQEALDTFGRLDALCNIAGVIMFNHSTDMPQADWDKTIAVNLSAPFFLSQAAIPHLLEQNGAIVNVTSSAAYFGEAYAAAYCEIKAGLMNLTKAMAMEYIHKPLRINAVAPGGMNTNIVSNFVNMPKDLDASLLARFKPLRGLVEVEDASNLIAFLASDAARAYHGSCIAIDQGITSG